MQCGIYLIETAGAPVAIMMRGPDDRTGIEDVTLEVCAADQALAQRVLDEVGDQVDFIVAFFHECAFST